MMHLRAVRGTHDILPGLTELWQEIEAAARQLFGLYGFAEIRTPIIEQTELFARSIGLETDIVRKEMYTFADSKGKSLTLRPEGTAPIVRAFIQHRLNTRSELGKFFYIGPMFRHERPQKGRYRQFHQIGAEVLGSDHPALEAEMLEMLTRFLEQLGVDNYKLLVNSVGCRECRPAYLGLLRTALNRQLDSFCAQCRRRAQSNPLRVFDCKMERCQPLIKQLPMIESHLGPECQQHQERFFEHLRQLEIPYHRDPTLVRGLDYYVQTTFEITSDSLGPTQNALLGGGRYDGLSELLGGPEVKGFGFALGLERFVLLLAELQRVAISFRTPAPDLFLVYLDQDTVLASLKLAGELRRQGVFTYVDFKTRSVKAQMRLANRLRSRFVCVLGSEELTTGVYRLKNMSDGSQQELARADLAEAVSRAEC